MPMINTFGVIGGDERMKYLAQSIAADGYPVCVCGLEKLGTCRGAAECDLPQLAAKSSVILLPLPATKDGLFLNAPYAENEIRLDDDFARLFMHKTVCGGMLQRLTVSSSLWREIDPKTTTAVKNLPSATRSQRQRAQSALRFANTPAR